MRISPLWGFFDDTNPPYPGLRRWAIESRPVGASHAISDRATNRSSTSEAVREGTLSDPSEDFLQRSLTSRRSFAEIALMKSMTEQALEVAAHRYATSH